jgi:hypothetical protein
MIIQFTKTTLLFVILTFPTLFACVINQEIFKPCAACHGYAESPVPWLYGSEAFQKAKKFGQKLYDKPCLEGRAHGGGKGFTQCAQIKDYVEEIKSKECDQIPEKTSVTFSHLTHMIETLVGEHRKTKVNEVIAQYKNQLGYVESPARQGKSDKLPLTPETFALLKKVFSWTCAEVADRYDWATLSPQDFRKSFENFLLKLMPLKTQERKDILDHLIQKEEKYLQDGHSLRSSRVALCHVVIVSERIWLR